MTTPIEPPVPPHTHVFEWEDDGMMYDAAIVGVRCTFTYEIPPGPRGKKPRVRKCREFRDLDAVLALYNQAAK